MKCSPKPMATQPSNSAGGISAAHANLAPAFLAVHGVRQPAKAMTANMMSASRQHPGGWKARQPQPEDIEIGVFRPLQAGRKSTRSSAVIRPSSVVAMALQGARIDVGERVVGGVIIGDVADEGEIIAPPMAGAQNRREVGVVWAGSGRPSALSELEA